MFETGSNQPIRDHHAETNYVVESILADYLLRQVFCLR